MKQFFTTRTGAGIITVILVAVLVYYVVYTLFIAPSQVPNQEFDRLFLSIIAGLVIFVIYTSLRTSNEKWKEDNWLKNFNDKIVRDKNLNFETSAISEIHEAISTVKEKCALVFPGLSLVIGLLGTFLAISWSLGKAKDIFVSNTDITNEQMAELGKLIGDLSFSFTTSIYGIIGFILMRVLNLIMEGQRLSWLVEKTHEEIKTRKKKEKEEENKWHESVIDGLNAIKDGIKDGIQSSLEDSNSRHSKVVEKLGIIESSFDRNIKNASSKIGQLLEKLSQVSEDSERKRNSKVIEKLEIIGSSLGTLVELPSAMKDSVQKLSTAADKTTKSAETMADSAKSLKESSGTLEKSIDEFNTSVKGFDSSVKETLRSIENNFIANIEKSSKQLTESSNGIIKGVNDMVTASKDSYRQLNESVGKIEKLTENSDRSLKDSLKNSRSTEQATMDMKKTIEDSLKAVSTGNMKIEGGLSEMKNTNNQSLGSLNEILSKVSALEEIKKSVDSGLKAVSQSNMWTIMDDLNKMEILNRQSLNSINEILSKMSNLFPVENLPQKEQLDSFKNEIIAKMDNFISKSSMNNLKDEAE